MGDIDGDGVPDLAAGAHGNWGSSRGAVHVMLMNADGTVKSTSEINDTTPNGPVLADHDHFGSSVTLLGDLDGDGVPDLAVGAYHDNAGGDLEGHRARHADERRRHGKEHLGDQRHHTKRPRPGRP